jgi:hypothetical protein
LFTSGWRSSAFRAASSAVVTGDGNHRQDLAVLRVHRDADSLRELVFLDAFAELGVEKLLETVIDRQ